MGTDWPEKADCQVAAAFAGCGGGREWDCGAAGIGREKAADIDYGYTDARAERSAAAAASPGKGLDVDVIILSGYAEFSYAQAALRYGAKDYLLKPVEPERLQEALGKIIRRWEAKGGEAEGGSWEGRDCQESQGEGRESEEIISVMQQIVMEIQESYPGRDNATGAGQRNTISVKAA